MCCTGDGAGPELERVLNHLLALLEQQDFDYVLIETSGLVCLHVCCVCVCV